MPKRQPATLPIPPTLWKTIGPSFILLGLALGSGELLLWPYLAANYGLGLVWGGLLGVTLQYLLNTEAMRYSLAWGESVFLGFRKLSRWIPLWYVLSTFIPWSLPALAVNSAHIINHAVPQLPSQAVGIGLLLLTGTILTAGKTLYTTMEKLQRTMLMITLPVIFGLALWLTQRSDWVELGQGLLGQGNGWQFFPPGIAIASFLGAFAYAGAGGNLNLAQSYYIKEKGFGMGKFSEKITSLLSGGTRAFRLEGQLPSLNTTNRERWKEWWRLITTEHFLIFWFLGLFSILLLSILSKALTYGQATQSGLSFLFFEAQMMGQRTHAFLETFFLLSCALMLFTTQTGILESSSRIISENVLLLRYKPGRKFPLSFAFYAALWGQILLGVLFILSGEREPRLLLTWSAILNAAAMMTAFPLLLWLNTKHLPVEFRPGWLRKIGLLIALGFFAFFFVLLVRDQIM